MKTILLSLMLVFTSALYSQNEDVKQVVVTFFKGFHAKDSITMKSVCTEKMILQSISETSKGNQLKKENPHTFYLSIATIPPTILFEERILNYSIQVDGSMAHVWTPYEFYVNNKFSHKGVNAFTLFKDNDQWKIVYLIDTRRK
jgi:hypothetical protein